MATFHTATQWTLRLRATARREIRSVPRRIEREDYAESRAAGEWGSMLFAHVATVAGSERSNAANNEVTIGLTSTKNKKSRVPLRIRVIVRQAQHEDMMTFAIIIHYNIRSCRYCNRADLQATMCGRSRSDGRKSRTLSKIANQHSKLPCDLSLSNAMFLPHLSLGLTSLYDDRPSSCSPFSL